MEVTMATDLVRTGVLAVPTDSSHLSDERAEASIAKLGFLVFHDPVSASGGAPSWHLIVALRAKPTTTHFDPERVSLWANVGGRGALVEIDRGGSIPRCGILWGPVRIDDRFHIQNTFLTFGGAIRRFEPDRETSVVVVDSSAPIMRWAGHSQELDPLATNVAVFFARLRVAAFDPAVEACLAAATPSALYAAFVEDRQACYERTPILADVDTTSRDWIAREEARLASTSPDEWLAAGRLLTDIGLRPERAVAIR
jgi:hypothetical protein